jgi:hypothetical protein
MSMACAAVLVATTGSVELLEIDRLRATWTGKTGQIALGG